MRKAGADWGRLLVRTYGITKRRAEDEGGFARNASGVGGICAVEPTGTAAAASDDAQVVAALDTTYQAAVKANDAAGMAAILLPDFLVVGGAGERFDRKTLLLAAQNKFYIYEHQEEDAGSQVVHVYGDTAVVTACLWRKGAKKDGSSPFDAHGWFSDTYVRTPTGWRYAFGQASLPLPSKTN